MPFRIVLALSLMSHGIDGSSNSGGYKQSPSTYVDEEKELDALRNGFKETVFIMNIKIRGIESKRNDAAGVNFNVQGKGRIKRFSTFLPNMRCILSNYAKILHFVL